MITIFTPTYNRCDLLMKLYESIKNQTVKDIEWIIVDDGSSDDTPNIIDNLIKEENEFEIKYFYKENHGRHTAINRGVEEASGEYFMLVDSDDFLPSNAVENILKMFKKIEGKENFAGVAGLKAYPNNVIIGKTFDEEYVECTSLEREKNNIYGDRAEVFYLDTLKKFPFPVFEGENYLAESLVWYRIANAGYKIHWENVIVYYADYLEGGLSRTTGKCLKNFQGFKLMVKEALTYREISLVEKIKLQIVCGGLALIKKEKIKDVAKYLGVCAFKLRIYAIIGFLAKKIRG